MQICLNLNQITLPLPLPLPFPLPLPLTALRSRLFPAYCRCLCPLSVPPPSVWNVTGELRCAGCKVREMSSMVKLLSYLTTCAYLCYISQCISHDSRHLYVAACMWSSSIIRVTYGLHVVSHVLLQISFQVTDTSYFNIRIEGHSLGLKLDYDRLQIEGFWDQSELLRSTYYNACITSVLMPSTSMCVLLSLAQPCGPRVSVFYNLPRGGTARLRL